MNNEMYESMLSENKGDYLTGFAVKEVTEILENISKLEEQLTTLKNAIDAKKVEIKTKEENNNNN